MPRKPASGLPRSSSTSGLPSGSPSRPPYPSINDERRSALSGARSSSTAASSTLARAAAVTTPPPLQAPPSSVGVTWRTAGGEGGTTAGRTIIDRYGNFVDPYSFVAGEADDDESTDTVIEYDVDDHLDDFARRDRALGPAGRWARFEAFHPAREAQRKTAKEQARRAQGRPAARCRLHVDSFAPPRSAQQGQTCSQAPPPCRKQPAAAPRPARRNGSKAVGRR